MNDLELYDKAIRHYGIKNQLVMVMEECSELAKECSKVYRALDNGGEFAIDGLVQGFSTLKTESKQRGKAS